MSNSIEVANLSNTGRRRPHNEDSAVTDSALGLAIVADGMGGYKAGEVASAIVAKMVLDAVRDGLRSVKNGQVNEDSGMMEQTEVVRTAVLEANAHVFNTAQTVPQCQGMGTTIVCLLVRDARMTVAHVGDSRLYRLKNEELSQVTSDHSLIQELIDRGFFTPEEAVANTPKNLVTRALGIEESVEVDVQELDVSDDEIYLLCSDGLNDMVEDEEIRLTLSKYSANLEQAAEELVRLANENGGKDNVSVVLVRPKTQAPTRLAFINKFNRLLKKGS
ncbi:MAG: Stp1/IreP family PP2C-type Ser/Thr phosphatase [Pseudomonadota bacterium]